MTLLFDPEQQPVVDGKAVCTIEIYARTVEKKD
jgi:hypothetical protein